MRRNPLLFAFLVIALCACGGDDSSPSAPADSDPSTRRYRSTLDSADVPDDESPGDGQAPGSGDPLTELVSGLRSPRDLVFGPTGSGLEDELFVVHFDGVEATWVQAVDSKPVLQRFENSLVGASADRHGVQIVAENLLVTDDILPSYLLVDGDRLLIAETGANRVLAWVDEELDIFADASVGLAQPVGVAALPSGNILVANHGDGMLVELDAKGAFQRTVDTELGDNRLLSVAVRSDGSVFIVDDEGGFGSLYRVMLP